MMGEKVVLYQIPFVWHKPIFYTTNIPVFGNAQFFIPDYALGKTCGKPQGALMFNPLGVS